MIIEISVAIIALAFVVLVIYLIMTLKETQKVLKNVNLMSYDINEKVNTLNPLFKTIENVGQVLEKKTNNFKHRALSKMDSTDYQDWVNNNEPKEEREAPDEVSAIVSDLVDLTSIGVRLWQTYKKRR